MVLDTKSEGVVPEQVSFRRFQVSVRDRRHLQDRVRSQMHVQGPTTYQEEYSKELSLGNQPLETQRWIWPQFLGNWLAGPSVSKMHTGHWKLSAGFDSSFLETGWLAQRGRFPTLGSLLILVGLNEQATKV